MATKWTRELIIRTIVDREARGLSLTLGGEDGIHSTIYQAARRIFGSWQNAIAAAGIPPGRALPYERWTPARIVLVIRNLSRRKEPLTVAELERRYGNMVASARRLFGSWPKAVLAAGIDPAKLRNGMTWTRGSIIEAILTRALKDDTLNERSVRPRSLLRAAKRVFGSWAAANEAAGFDPQLQRLRPEAVEIEGNEPLHCKVDGRGHESHQEKASERSRRWTPANIITGILRLQEQGKRLNASVVSENDDPLYRAAIRHFGTWDNALIAAGLQPSELRRQYTAKGARYAVGRDVAVAASKADAT